MIGRLALVCALVVLVIASARTEPLQVSIAQQVTSTPTRTPTATPSATASATPSRPQQVASTTPTASLTPTSPPTPGSTTPTASTTATRTAGSVQTPTITRTPTRTATITITSTPSRTATVTQTIKPSPSATPTITATVVPPLFSAIDSSSVTRSSATITWITNVPTSAQVEYGIASVDTSKSLLDTSLLTAHRVVLTGLMPGATYRFRVRGTSADSGAGISAESSVVTAPAGSGPEIASVGVRQVTGTTATVQWATSTGSAAQLEYGTTANYASFTLLKAFASPTQEMNLTGLLASTRYHFRVKAWDGSGFLGASADATFTTAPAGPATLLGDQTVQTERLTLIAGQAAAYQYVASRSGLASLVRLYVDVGSTTPVIRVALYSDQDGVPGTILSQSSAPGLVPGWLDITIPPVPLLESTRYWVAVLSPLGSGNLNLRQAAIGGSSVTSSQAMLAAFPMAFRVGTTAARSPLTVDVQQLPPAITLTGPTDGSIVSGRVQLSAVIDDDAPLARVQFYEDGVPVGAALVTPPYAATWDSAGSNPSVPHTFSARATDLMGRSGTSGQVSVQVDNGPVISGVSMGPGLSARSARITWTTDMLADGQVEFGPTLAYGTSTPLDARPEWRHEMQLTGLLPATLYHYRVRSRDANGALAVSADQVFFTP